jgi:hypothetical protein
MCRVNPRHTGFGHWVKPTICLSGPANDVALCCWYLLEHRFKAFFLPLCTFLMLDVRRIGRRNAGIMGGSRGDLHGNDASEERWFGHDKFSSDFLYMSDESWCWVSLFLLQNPMCCRVPWVRRY